MTQGYWVIYQIYCPAQTKVTVILGGRPHEIALLRNAHALHRFGRLSTRILKTQRLKTHFIDNGSQGGEIQKRSPPVVMWTANLHTFRNNDAIAPPLDLLNLWTLRRLITTTTTLAIFIFFLLCSVSPSTVCLFTACKLNAHVLCLPLHFWWMSSTTYRPGVWTTALSQIFLKWWWGRLRKKRLFSPVWTGPWLDRL